MLGLDGTTVTSVGILRNNLAYSNNGHTLLTDLTNGGPISDEYDSWDANLNLTVTAADFQSVAFAPPASCPEPYAPGGTRCCAATDLTCFAGMASARNPDGSLPVLPFLRLAPTSPLIDKGTNVGLPFAGSAPDLGCFETGLVYDPSDGGAPSDGGSPSDGGTSSGSGTSTSSSSASTGGSASTGSSVSSGSGGATSPSGGGGSSSRATGGGGSGGAGELGSPTGCGCLVTGGDTEGGAAVLAMGVVAAGWRRRRGRAGRRSA
jgi:hypothetical protein